MNTNTDPSQVSQEKCAKCGRKFLWSVGCNVFSSDVEFNKITLCDICIYELKGIMEEWLRPSSDEEDS